ncbi:MAG: hypothetical protein ACR2HS_01920, partial [Gammaproteobacteria bacterium]
MKQNNDRPHLRSQKNIDVHMKTLAEQKKDLYIETLLKAEKITEDKLQQLINSNNIDKLLKVVTNDIIFKLILKGIINIDQAINMSRLDFTEQEKATLRNVKIQDYLQQGLINLDETITSAKNNSVTTFTDPDLTYIQDYFQKEGTRTPNNRISLQLALQLGDNERRILRIPIIKGFIERNEITIKEAIDHLVNQPWLTFSDEKILQFIVDNYADINITNKEKKITAKDALKINEAQRNCLSNDLVVNLINNNKLSIHNAIKHSEFINKNKYFLHLLKMDLLTKEQAELILEFDTNR